ncbi:MAG: hypothetical protein PHV30_01545 [Candidatus Margulisbacteria bacterium]|nr:hypothetical protein [Candidatus Margulisiibacteriota bacterium]
MKLKNKKFDFQEYTEAFIDSSDNDDLESYISQDFEESVKIEQELLPELCEEDLRKVIKYMKRNAKNVINNKR